MRCLPQPRQQPALLAGKPREGLLISLHSYRLISLYRSLNEQRVLVSYVQSIVCDVS